MKQSWRNYLSPTAQLVFIPHFFSAIIQTQGGTARDVQGLRRLLALGCLILVVITVGSRGFAVQ